MIKQVKFREHDSNCKADDKNNLIYLPSKLQFKFQLRQIHEPKHHSFRQP